MVKRGVFLSLSCALLAACESVPETWTESSRERIESSLGAAAPAQTATIPPAVSQALLPPIEIRLPDGASAPLEPRFDLNVTQAPVRQVFLGLVEGTPYSAVLDPHVSGSVTLQLKGVTVPEAIEAIRRAYGYDYRREGNRFFIREYGMQTRIFPVNYLHAVRKARSMTRGISGELTQATSSASGTSSGAPAPGTSGSPAGSNGASVQVETSTESDFWKELRETLAALVGCGTATAVAPPAGGTAPGLSLSCPGGRMVAINPQASLAIVRAMPPELRLVEEFLGTAQAAINRQVILEAKIVEVQLKDGYQTGINWSGIGRQGGTTVIGSQTGGGSALDAGVAESAGQTTSSLFSPIATTAYTAFGGIFSLAVRASDFSAFIELLRTQGDIHVLSSPRVSTVNNQKAVIKVGGDEFFVTNVSTTTVTSGTSTTSEPSVTLTPFFSGIALDVTPQIDESNNILLHIHPSVSEVTQQTKTFRVSGRDFSLPLAISTIQESDNVVRAASGQIIVIGGLMKEGSSDDDAGIPILADVPVLGNAFKHKRVTRIKKELVILLKPTVVDLPPVWAESAQESLDRVRKIKRIP